MGLINEYMLLMMVAVMNSWFVLLLVCLRPFILINCLHMCSFTFSLQGGAGRHGGQTGKRRTFVLQQINKGESAEVKRDRDEERRDEEEWKSLRQRETEGRGGGNAPSCDLHPASLPYSPFSN